MTCEFCLKSFVASPNILRKSKHVCCKNCKSLAAHWTVFNLSGDKYEWFLSHRKPINFEYLCDLETFNKFGYKIFELPPFSTKKIVAKCRFCLNQFDVKIGKLSRNNYKPTCKQCCNISSAYSRSKNFKNEHEYFKIIKSKQKSKRESSVTIFDHNFIDSEATFKKFGYRASDISPCSRKKIILLCEFCLRNFEARRSKLSLRSKAVCCKECGGLCISYFKQGKSINKHEFYLLRQINIASINYSFVDTDATMDPMAVKRRKPKDERKEKSMRVRVTEVEKEAWTKAAEKEGRDLSNWLRFVANREAERTIPKA